MKKLFAMCLLSVTAGCSSPYATNGEHLYKMSHNGPELTIPGTLTANNISHFYDLPNQTQNPDVSIAPPRVLNV